MFHKDEYCNNFVYETLCYSVMLWFKILLEVVWAMKILSHSTEEKIRFMEEMDKIRGHVDKFQLIVENLVRGSIAQLHMMADFFLIEGFLVHVDRKSVV